jgi:formiminoglutamase
MNLNDYFNPVEIFNTNRNSIHPGAQLISVVSVHSKNKPISNISDYNLALFGVSNNNLEDIYKDEYSEIREELYSLSANYKTKLFDLGNLKQGKTKNDTIIGLRDVIIELISLNVIPIILGNSEDILYAQYLAYKKLDTKVNIIAIDSKIAAIENKETKSPSTLWKILVSENDFLSGFSNIGYQTYYVNPKTLQFLSKNYFNAFRIGHIRSNFKEVEPLLRDANLIGINIASIRQPDAPAQNDGSPNGFYGEEICQIAKYAGTSNRASSIGIYDYNPDFDQNKQTSRLIAQLIWYYIEGFNQRVDEHPQISNSQFKKFLVALNKTENELVFYKSEKTDRWWMEVPFIQTSSSKKVLISCTFEDYQKATSDELPERWLTTFNKINKV